MVNINELSEPSKSLKAAELEGNEVTMVIKNYIVKEFDEVDTKTGQTYKSKKPIFDFEDTDKTFVCNKTNRNAIAYAYGDEMDDWIGKPITLYPTMVQFGDKMVEAIRVRVVKAATGKPKFLKSKNTGHPFAPGNGDPLDDPIPF